MTKYRWRAVVIEERKGMITRMARTVEATDLNAARTEVDRLGPRRGTNCLQILDEGERVVSYKLLEPDHGLAGWR